MYKILYWILGILIAALIVLGIYILIQIKNTPAGTTAANTQTYTTQNTTDSNSAPVSSTASNPNSYQVSGQDGHPIAVKDFLHNGETVPDTVNPGYYYLAGSIGYCLANGQCPSGYKTNDFTVTYNTATEQFNVALLTKPLAAARTEAENFLMNRLGLHRIFLCNLRYYVSVPISVDSTLAGSDLGFTPCPGATAL